MDQKSPRKNAHITVVGASLLLADLGEASQKLNCFSIAHGKANLPLNLNHGEVKQKCPGMVSHDGNNKSVNTELRQSHWIYQGSIGGS